MRRAPYKRILPTGGVNRDINSTELAENQAPVCSNFRVLTDYIETRSGYAEYGSNLPLPSQIMGVYRFRTLGGTDYQLAFDTDNAWLYDNNNNLDSWQILTQGHVIADCEVDNSWTAAADVTASQSSTSGYFKRGSTSTKLVIAAAFTTGIAAYDDFSAIEVFTAADDRDTHLHVWIYSDVALDAADASIRLSEAANAGTGSTYRDIDLPAISAATWTRCIVADALTDLNAVVSVGYIVNTDKGAQTVYLDDIRTVKQFTGDEDDLFHCTTMPSVGGEKVFIANGINQVQEWNGTDDTFSDLSGSPVTSAKYVGTYKNHLLLLATADSSNNAFQRVWRSDIGDASDWTTGSAGFNDRVEDDSDIMGGINVGDAFVILKGESIENMRYIGGFSIFSYLTQITGIGTVSGFTAQQIPGNMIIFLGNDYGVYQYDLNVVIPVSENTVKQWIADNINTERKHRSFAFVWSDRDEYHLWIPTGSNATPNRALVYNYVNKTWTDYDVPATAAGIYYPSSTTTWDHMTGTWDAASSRWDDLSGSKGTRQPLIGDSSGYIYAYGNSSYDDSATIISDYQTRDFQFGTDNQLDRVIELVFEASGDNVTISHSFDGGLSWTGSETHALTASWTRYSHFVNARSGKIRFRFYNATAGEKFAVKWYEPWVVRRNR